MQFLENSIQQADLHVITRLQHLYAVDGWSYWRSPKVIENNK